MQRNCIRIKICALNSTCICTLFASHWPEIYSPAYVSGASNSAVKSSDSARTTPRRRGSFCKWRPPATAHPTLSTPGNGHRRTAAGCAAQSRGRAPTARGDSPGTAYGRAVALRADLGRVGGWPGTVALRRRMSSPCTKAATRTFRNLGELHKSAFKGPLRGVWAGSAPSSGGPNAQCNGEDRRVAPQGLI